MVALPLEKPGKPEYIRWFDVLGKQDVPLVGGKNASLGEMIAHLSSRGIRVPGGFATTSDAYFAFLHFNHLQEKIQACLRKINVQNIRVLKTAGHAIRTWILASQFPADFKEEICAAYKELSHRYHAKNLDVAVRSSATAEDLPTASFAGQQETFLHIRGEKDLLEACVKCYASLFTDRAIAYREAKGFDHFGIALSIGIQKMVRADRAGAGVAFSLDPDTGFPKVVVINAAWGLGENVVQGSVNPDEYMVFKPLLHNKNVSPIIEKVLGKKEKKMVYGSQQNTKNIPTSPKEQNTHVLNDQEILQLANWIVLIEQHYGRAMDVEWVKDGIDNELYIVQARPETVQTQKKQLLFQSFTLKEKGEKLIEGLAIGQAITHGKVQIIKTVQQMETFQTGSILVTKMTSPDWVPIMQRASGIITDLGGRTSHAAIVSRELGIPAIVGTNAATSVLKNGKEITLSCAEGDIGTVYKGILSYEAKEEDLRTLPKIKTDVLMNIASPIGAFRWWQLPCQGVGLARMEFIIDNIIKIHPLALVRFSQLRDRKVRDQIEELTKTYKNKSEYFIDHLAQGIAKIAAVHYPNPVIVRMSDFKTNEYANLIGGAQFEPKEENPMLGFRGASRYYSPHYRDGFALECAAIKRVRDQLGLQNVIVMIPFCRTLDEADNVLHVLEQNGLQRKKNNLLIYVMAEIPSNIILAKEFADRFDGFSIGSNDLTQLTLGIDRDSTELAASFDERNPAIKDSIRSLIKDAHAKGRKVGICGQAPSDYPDFAAFLVESGIDSISLNPDSIVGTIRRLAQVEAKLLK